MTLYELERIIEELIDEGYGSFEVRIPSQTGGDMPVNDVEEDDNDLTIFLS